MDNALYNGFGQRQVATIYDELNQYRVIMGVAPMYTRSPEALKDIYVPARRVASTASTQAATVATSSTSSAVTATAAPTAGAVNPGLRRPATGQAVSATPTTHGAAERDCGVFRAAHPSAVSHHDAETGNHHLSTTWPRGRTLAEGRRTVAQAEAEIGLPRMCAQLPGHAPRAAGPAEEQPM